MNGMPTRPGTAGAPRSTGRARMARLCMALLLGCGALAGCSTVSDAVNAPEPPAFAAYQSRTLAQVRQQRAFQTADQNAELRWNSPQEWRPSAQPGAEKPEKGILLVHGLGDSPWSFQDLGPTLAAQGFLVRSVLLPGHGTQPADLQGVTLEQWQQTVREQAQALQRDVEQVYLGGFSTGANLVLEHAYRQPQIAGLLLFSPGFRSDSTFDWLTPWIAPVRPWLIAPDGSRPLQNSVRYLNVPTNGFAQFYRSSRAVRSLIDAQPFERPVLMVVAQHDSVLDTAYLLDVFQTRFTHPDSRLIWYGNAPGPSNRPRVLVRLDHIPEQRISQFSHMGVLFSPANPLYGAEGSLRLCLNGQEPAATQACEDGQAVWFSDWGYREAGKPHARLTFNPYFDWQSAVMAAVLRSGQAPPVGLAAGVTP